MRYYFHVREQERLIRDREGSELHDIVAARIEAWANARDFAIDDLRGGQRIGERHIEITDREGTVLDCVSVTDAVAPRRLH